MDIRPVAALALVWGSIVPCLAQAVPQYRIVDLGHEIASGLSAYGSLKDGLRIGPSGEVAAAVNGNLLISRNGLLATIAAPSGWRIDRVTDINGKGDVLLSLWNSGRPRGAAVRGARRGVLLAVLPVRGRDVPARPPPVTLLELLCAAGHETRVAHPAER